MRKAKRRKPSIKERAIRIAKMVDRLAKDNLCEPMLDVTALYRLQEAVNDAAFGNTFKGR